MTTENNFTEEQIRTEERLNQLQINHSKLTQALNTNNDAIQQMLGRLRLIQEQLGDVPPMTDLSEEMPSREN